MADGIHKTQEKHRPLPMILLISWQYETHTHTKTKTTTFTMFRSQGATELALENHKIKEACTDGKLSNGRRSTNNFQIKEEILALQILIEILSNLAFRVLTDTKPPTGIGQFTKEKSLTET